MIEHIPDLLASGADSLKIEGRMKTALYVATVARTYRKAIDDYRKDPALYQEHLPGTGNRSQAAPTGGLPQGFSTASLPRRIRSTMPIPTPRITFIWGSRGKQIKTAGPSWNRKISFP